VTEPTPGHPTPGRLTGTRARPVVEHRRRYAATPAELWAAWTRPEQLARWLAEVDSGRVAAGERVAVRLRVGAQAAHPASWAVRVAREPEYLELEWDDGHDVGGTLAVTLTPDGPRHTVLQLRHELAASPAAIDDAPTMGAGWDGYLTGLGVVLAGGDDEAVVAAELERFGGSQAIYRGLAAAIADD
jgi:uncharacterized protein YndB with AHSA1/START domain